MKPGALSYVRPTSVREAIASLEGGGVDAKVIAGGQSLVPMLNLRMVTAERLIDIGAISDLRGFSSNDREVRIGACVTHERIQLGEVDDPSHGLMPKVASAIAYQAVRNRGTIGGSMALADPSADWLTTTAALGATVEWEGPEGKNSCLSEEFVVAAYTTQLGMSDLLTGIRIPKLHPDAKWGTYKLCRKVGEFAHAMAVAIRSPDSARAFLGATEGAPVRLKHTEGVLSALKDWKATHAAALSQSMEADITESGREFDDVHARQLRTCLLRSVQMSFGVKHSRAEEL